MQKTKSLLLVLISVLFIHNIYAQKNSVKLIASPRKDSVLLRWAPANSKTWRLGNKYGYSVKRYTLLKGKKIPKIIPHTILNKEPLKPADIKEWEKYADDKYIAVAADCIFGSVFKEASVSGNPFVAYKKYKEEKHRFSFALYAADQSVRTAKMSGLYFADKTAKQNEKYLYKVYINTPDSVAVDTASFFTGLSEYQALPKPITPKAEWSDKKVDIAWNIIYLKHIYNSYILERSADGKNYSPVSENATVQVSDKNINPAYMYKTDTLPDNKTTLYYRVRGISAFGETGPASDSIFGNGTLPLKNAPVIINHKVTDNTTVTLQWEYPEKMNDYIDGFNIYRSEKPSGKKLLIYHGNNPAKREFTDTIPGFTNYYMISVYNKQKEKLSLLRTYAERVDSFPPAVPLNVMGTVDTTGKVTLHWSSNTDRDISGYRVYRANNPHFEFMLAHPDEIKDTLYNETINLKTLTKHIYYRVKAIDQRMNQSAFSSIIEIKRPDIIPPVSPVIKDISNKKSIPTLHWVNSSSTDVVSHKIFRRTKTDSLPRLIATLQRDKSIRSSYTDKSVEPGNEYIYHITATDDSNLQSAPSNPGYFKIPSGIKERIRLKKRVYTDKVKLIWTIRTDKEVERVIVYRSVDKQQIRLYGNSDTNSFTDDRLSPEKTYRYTIRAQYKDGSTSVLSNTITVKK